MNVDTDQFMALRGEVAEIAARQRREAAECAAGLLAEALAQMPPELRVITGGGRHAAPRKPRLRLVKGGGR